MPPSGAHRWKGITAEQRFWGKVQIRSTDQCWPWLGCKNHYGYGVISVHGKNRMAHVFSWEIHHKASIFPGLEGCHKCDSPGCVNPDHIWPGTHAENLLDSALKGRMHPGSNGHMGMPRVKREFCASGKHKMTDDNVYCPPRSPLSRTCIACSRERHKEYISRKNINAEINIATS